MANAIQWAADLLPKLKATGTGEAKIEGVKAAMAARFAAFPELAPDHPDRHLTAAEAVQVLERNGAGEVTLDKARQLVRTGHYEAPKLANPADLLPPPPKADAPERSLPEEPEPHRVAGVYEVNAREVDTVGPKAAEPEPEPAAPAKKARK